jgi:hypothetical protein
LFASLRCRQDIALVVVNDAYPHDPTSHLSQVRNAPVSIERKGRTAAYLARASAGHRAQFVTHIAQESYGPLSEQSLP